MKDITAKPISDTFEKSIQKTGLCALILMLTTIGCAMVMFVFGIPMGSYSAIIPIAEIALYSIIFDRQMFKSLFINIAVLAVWAFVCYSVFDWSYDGMYYHKQAIITLADGWNPLRMSSGDFNWLNGTMDLSLWLDNYPKGIWICSAAVYALTGFLETAKSVNILFIIMLLCTAYSAFKTVYSFSSRRSWIISAFICLNPVFICQIFTSYNDMAVGTLIITAALLGMKIYAERADEIDYITLFCVTAMSCLVKFTAPLLVGLVLIAYGAGYLVKTRGRNFSLHFKKPAAVIISGFLIGTVILGADPYIKHLVNGQNLVYPVMGEGKYDIINTNASQGLEGKPEALKYFISLASESNSNFKEHYKIKIPFSIHSREVLYLNNADIRLGGFGVWFGGALLLALACAAAALFKKHRMKAETAILLITFFALGLFFPEAWWARYASYTYYIPIFLMIYAGSSPVKSIKEASLAVAAVLLINSTLSAVCVIKSGIKEKAEIDKYLDIIKSQNKSIILRVNDFPSHVKLFEEKGIDFTLSPISLYDPIEFYKTTKFEYVD